MAVASVGIGIACGVLVVLSLFTVRKKISASSLTHHHAFAGRMATVQVPFDYSSKGKIVLSYNHSTQEIAAITDCPHVFGKGDRVLIVQVSKSCAWVVPDESFNSS